MDRAGLVGDDGPTHHGAFDIAYLRCLPNIVLMAPRDEAMLVHMLRTALTYDDGPVALRYPRGEARRRAAARPSPRRSRSAPARSCARATRVALARLRHRRRARRSRRPTCWPSTASTVTVADARFAKPLDAGLLAQLAAEHELLVTVEEGVLAGGFGIGGLGGAQRRRAPTCRGSCASACPTATSRTASPALLHEEVGFTGERDRRAHQRRARPPGSSPELLTPVRRALAADGSGRVPSVRAEGAFGGPSREESCCRAMR